MIQIKYIKGVTKNAPICMKLVFFIFICSSLLWGNSVFAQKIKVIKGKKRKYNVNIVTFDTLNIEIKIKQLDVRELKFYSIALYSTLPPDLTILIDPFAYNKRNQDNAYLFYNLKQSDYLTLLDSYYFQNIYNNAGYFNPFLLPNRQKKYHVFLLEIQNNNSLNISLDPDLIKAATQNHVKKSILTLNFFRKQNEGPDNKFDKEKKQNIFRILEDNLFKERVIFPDMIGNGLICFPMNRPTEKITEITIPHIEYFQKQKDLIIKLKL